MESIAANTPVDAEEESGLRRMQMVAEMRRMAIWIECEKIREEEPGLSDLDVQHRLRERLGHFGYTTPISGPFVVRPPRALR